MAQKNLVVRVDSVQDIDFEDPDARVFVGGAGGATRYESVDEAIDDLSFNHGPYLRTTTRDVTTEVGPHLVGRAQFGYAPDGLTGVRYIEVTRTSVVAVYMGTARPNR